VKRRFFKVSDNYVFPVAFSVCFHLLFLCCVCVFARSASAPEIVAELDFSDAPRAAAVVPARKVRKRAAPVTPVKRSAEKITVAKETEETAKTSDEALPVPDETSSAEPETESASAPSETSADPSSGEEADGAEEYLPASSLAKGPRWISNFITSKDYPLVARENGRDGLVVMRLHIGADGKVKEASLVSGSYAALNAAALSKIMEAVFIPAYDSSGRPVPCEVRLPIRFQLKS